MKPHKTFSTDDLAGRDRKRHGVKRRQAAEADSHAADFKN
jgi:hypothetical protein